MRQNLNVSYKKHEVLLTYVNHKGVSSKEANLWYQAHKIAQPRTPHNYLIYPI
jgi:hypothetical protein